MQNVQSLQVKARCVTHTKIKVRILLTLEFILKYRYIINILNLLSLPTSTVAALRGAVILYTDHFVTSYFC
jgi:hypothetical protein